MTLSNLIRKDGLAKVATATPATLATQEAVNAETVAKVATVAVASPPAPAMTAGEETAIRAWLAHIEETDPDIIAEVLNQCRTDSEVRAYFIRRADEVPSPAAREHWVTCGDCRHFQRIEHPHLGHCAQGEPEAIAGLWGSDRRWCESFALRSDAVDNGPLAHRKR